MATIPQQSAAKQKGKGGLSIEPTTTARLSTRSTARPTWQVQPIGADGWMLVVEENSPFSLSPCVCFVLMLAGNEIKL